MAQICPKYSLNMAQIYPKSSLSTAQIYPKYSLNTVVPLDGVMPEGVMPGWGRARVGQGGQSSQKQPETPQILAGNRVRGPNMLKYG